jgi:two-component system NtrC family sensor kinase
MTTRISRSIGAKLFAVVFTVLLLTLAALGIATVRLQRLHFERARTASAERISEVIRNSTRYYMLRNDRVALQHIIQTLGSDPSIVNLRIAAPDGHVAFSTKAPEVGTRSTPAPSGVRIFQGRGGRVLGIGTPIANSATCATAACHAHPASQQILGTLDLDLSLAAADADVRNTSVQFIAYSAVTIVITLLAIALVVWRIVHRPVHRLRLATERLAQGELGMQLPISSHDELGGLARSFNEMSVELHDAREQITAWANTLEKRVEEATAELRAAQDGMIQAEKLASLGKLAAVVAHEINNPLSGVLTYAKLLRKWIERGDGALHEAEMRDALQLIESETRRCGEIVRNLLTFARVTPMNVTEVDVNGVIKQCIKLVEHKLQLGNINPDLQLAENLPAVRGDTGQVEQLLLALIMNAIEAMPREGNLRIVTSAPEADNVVITVEDDGIGIPPALLPRLFDPFVTTKEDGKGTGLGLAICRSIIDRHRGKIEVKSEVGRGTAFTIRLPAAAVVEAVA